MAYVGKKHKKLGILMVLTCMITTFIVPVTGQASSSTVAFNAKSGVLEVDYAGYLSKHDLVYNSLINDPKQGIMVGNGRMGAQVWNTNGLTMQFTGVDASQECFASEGLVNLYTNPAMDKDYSTIQQRLTLYDELMTTKYDNNRTVTIMGSPNSEVMGIHVEDTRTEVSSVALDLGVWDLTYFKGGDVPDISAWKKVSTYTDANGAGISRGQTDPKHFGYTLAATVEGADFTTETVSGRIVRLNIKPTTSYTIWIACASRINAPNYDSVTQAKRLLSEVKKTGYDTTLTNYKNWWHSFWSKSFVQYSNASGDADYMENMYYLSTYMIAAGAYGNYPFHFINGVFSGVKDDDAGKWSYGYWYWNQRDIYNSFYASNHSEIMNGFNNLYSRNFSTLKDYTKRKFNIDGIWVPETMGWDGSPNGTIWSDYTKNIFSTGAEAAQNMYLQYKYTNDEKYLKDTAYPFMKEVCKFYTSKLSYDTTTGEYYMATSNSHETYWNVKNALTDLIAVRTIFPIAIQTAQKFGVDKSLVSKWKKIVNNLVAYPSDGTKYLPHELPLSPMRNNENVVGELLWPYGVTGIDAPDYSMALAAFQTRPNPYRNVWAPDAIQAARLGLGDEAYAGMKKMLQIYQNYPNTRTTNTNGEFEYHGVHLSAMNESLMQSYNDKIRVFPALPRDDNFVSKFTLLASGGFLVSSEIEKNEIKYVGIKSLYGNTVTLINPWDAKVQVRNAKDNKVIKTSSKHEITFKTAKNTIYVIEKASKPFSKFSKQQITASANEGVKTLSGTNSTLGTNKGKDAGTATNNIGFAFITEEDTKVTKVTFYQDTEFGGAAKTLDIGRYTTVQLAAAGIQDNWVSSVQLPKGYTVVIYEKDNFTGKSWTFTEDDASFVASGCNDVMSSVVITKN